MVFSLTTGVSNAAALLQKVTGSITIATVITDGGGIITVAHALRVLGENGTEEMLQNQVAKHVQLSSQIQTLFILRLQIQVTVGARLGMTALVLRT